MDVGDMLPPEHALLDELEVGRGTLREGLRLLELQGIIAMKAGPQGGPVVSRPDHGPLADTLALALQAVGVTFAEVIGARLAFEPNLARLAAECGDHGDAPNVTGIADTLVDLDRSLDDVQDFLRANQSFHRALAACARNRPLELFHLSLVKISDGHDMGVTYSASRRRAILAAHTELVDLIGAEDGEGAAAKARESINFFAEYLKRRHPDLLDRKVEWILD
jgi:DNA-binding FadR family transcriptional regulator